MCMPKSFFAPEGRESMSRMSAGTILAPDGPRRSMSRSALRARREHLGCVQYLIAVAAIVATLLAALAGANYALNPYLYWPGYKADVAAAFERGSNFAV